MNHADIMWLLTYHNRANAKIFETAAKLSQEQLMQPNAFDLDTAFQSLRHMVDVDWSWRLVAQGSGPIKDFLWERVPMNNFAEVRAAWEKDSADLLVFGESLDDTAAQKEVLINNETGERVPVWKILAHVVNHGTQHRAELARYFTVCGYSPGDLDLL
jgi:uncharacterized damage-inducible protein DinB